MEITTITSEEQYNSYCAILIQILDSEILTDEVNKKIESLELLINTWEEKNLKLPKYNPIELIQALMEVHNLSINQLADKLEVDKSLMSQILSYKKGLSIEVINKISNIFKVSSEVLSTPYTLLS